MSNHNIKVVQQDNGEWRAWCSCRAGSPISKHKWEVEDWQIRHERLVEQARAHLRGQPSLRATFTYYMEMSENPEVPQEQRAQWRILARGLQPRITGQASDPQPVLFDMKPLTKQANRKGSQ